MHIARAKLNVLGAIENLYWSMVDSSHAALMALKQVPPSPEHISEMLIEVFVKQRKLDKKYVEYYNQVYNLYHNINRGNINSISGKEVDEHIDKAIEFERVLRNLTIDAVKQEKIVKIEIKK